MASFPAWVRALLGSKIEHGRGPSWSGSITRFEEPGSFEEDHNAFALALYEELRASRRNLFFSPFSIRMALAMAYAGARGETASQMRGTLRFVSSDETLHLGFANVMNRLNAAGNDKCEVSVANSLWHPHHAPLHAEFADLVARHYGGGLNSVDFRQHPEAARVTINRWIEDETRGRIRELLSSGTLTDDTCLVLVNAVYFKGTWVLQFRNTDTRDEPFYVEGGGTVRAPLMYQRAQFRYLQDRGFQAVNLDFAGGDVSMIVFLPAEKDGLWDFETRVTARMLQDCFPRMVEHEVSLSLPRFKMTWGTEDVGRRLQALGMPMPFNQSTADFSGINGHRPPAREALFISAVLHQASVEVNEEGAEAAAATAVTMKMGAVSPGAAAFRADHPFLFAIRDTRSGAILFLGRVADPTGES